MNSYCQSCFFAYNLHIRSLIRKRAMNLSSEFQASGEALHRRLLELEGDGMQPFRTLVARDCITSVASFCLSVKGNGLIDLCVLADSDKLGSTLFEETYSPSDIKALTGDLLSSLQERNPERAVEYKSWNLKVMRWLDQPTGSVRLIEGVNPNVGSFLQNLRIQNGH